MQIQKINTSFYNKNSKLSSKPTFGSKVSTQGLKNINIGSMPAGNIGKIKVLKANGKEAWLDVIKSTYHDYETYNFVNELKQVIGKIEFRFNKYVRPLEGEKDHVFVTELRNFSDPNTPYYTKGLEEYNQIGTKLLQVAVKRSFENNCNGNIELVAKRRQEVLKFYEILGFRQSSNVGLYGNPYRLQLAEDKIESLAMKYGGI